MKKTNYLLTVILLIIIVIFTILVAKVDVKPVGPVNPETGVESQVGFSTINSAIAKRIDYNSTFYKISKYAGFLAFGFVALYAIKGLVEVVQIKSFKKVNKVIYGLAAFYFCVALVYILFEVMIVNYRPVIIDNELEASYPSSHTILAICVCGSSLIASQYVIKKDNLKKLLNIAAIIIMVLVIVTRFLSGVHWLTDIIGGVLISTFLLQLFSNIVKTLTKENKEEIDE